MPRETSAPAPISLPGPRTRNPLVSKTGDAWLSAAFSLQICADRLCKNDLRHFLRDQVATWVAFASFSADNPQCLLRPTARFRVIIRQPDLDGAGLVQDLRLQRVCPADDDVTGLQGYGNKNQYSQQKPCH